MTPARYWLPESTLLGPRAHAPIEASLLDWSGKWLAQGCLQPDYRWDQRAKGPHHRDIDIAPGLSLSCPADCRLTLATQLLSRPITQRHIRTVQDLAIIDLLLDAALQDLGQNLASLWTTAPAEDDSLRHSLPLAMDDGDPFIWLSVSQDRLTSLVRALAPPPRKLPAIAKPAEALTGQTIEIGGFLGSTSLSLRDIEKLQVGDVVLLDESAELPVDLTINGERQAAQGATVQANEKFLSLTFERSPDQW